MTILYTGEVEATVGARAIQLLIADDPAAVKCTRCDQIVERPANSENKMWMGLVRDQDGTDLVTVWSHDACGQLGVYDSIDQVPQTQQSSGPLGLPTRAYKTQQPKPEQ